MAVAPSAVFDIARKMMVDSQLRPNKVTSDLVISAMANLPRERFLPEALMSRAYSDENIRLGAGRVMFAPMAIARILQEAAVVAGERVLLIGAGTGYGAAVLAASGAKITAIEEDATLAAAARTNLAAYAPSVTLVEASLAAGSAAGAPYDCIIVEGGVADLPDAVLAQLATTGRVVMVQDQGPRIGVAVVGVKSGAGLSLASKFDCVAALLPGFAKAPAFVF